MNNLYLKQTTILLFFFLGALVVGVRCLGEVGLEEGLGAEGLVVGGWTVVVVLVFSY